MAFTNNQLDRVTELMDAYIENNRPPEEIRNQVDIAWKLNGQSVFIYEVRPHFLKPKEIIQSESAKATWVQASKEWKIFWLRASGKWERYDPLPSVGNLKRFLIEVETDPLGCFWG